MAAGSFVLGGGHGGRWEDGRRDAYRVQIAEAGVHERGIERRCGGVVVFVALSDGDLHRLPFSNIEIVAPGGQRVRPAARESVIPTEGRGKRGTGEFPGIWCGGLSAGCWM